MPLKAGFVIACTLTAAWTIVLGWLAFKGVVALF